jgi:uncharacterized membrane protein
MDSELVTLHFEDTESAEATMATIRSLQAQGFIELDDAAILTRPPTGGVTVTPVEIHGVPRKAAVGAVIGLVAGSVLGLPVLGAIAGGGVSGKRAVKDAVDRLDGLLGTVGAQVEAGSTVLALAVRSLPDPETVVDRLSIHRSAMTRVSIPAELRDEIERSGPDQD